MMINVKILAEDQKAELQTAKKIAGVRRVVLQSTGAVITDACSEVAFFQDHSQTGMVLMAGTALVTT